MTSTPGEVEAIGGDELLYLDGKRRSGGYAAIRTRPTHAFAFAVVGSLTDETHAEALAAKYAKRSRRQRAGGPVDARLARASPAASA